MVRTRRLDLRPVAPGVLFARTPLAGWVVLTDGDEVALVDCGYPRDLPAVRRSVRHLLGHDAPVRDLLVTHGHSDHIGTAARLVAQDGTRVHAAAAELPVVRRELHAQVGIRDVLRDPRPRVLGWAVRAVLAGGLSDVAVPGPVAVGPGPLRVAGHEVLPVPLPGHTPGHTAYLLPGCGALAIGDALVAAHPVSTRLGPQMLHPMFHHDPGAALAVLDDLPGLDVRLLLPGHGPAVPVDDLAAVVAEARAPQAAR
jgi:glyoxylase-like metal-dependent hydrolase (beta-lactamase superfamily II)